MPEFAKVAWSNRFFDGSACEFRHFVTLGLRTNAFGRTAEALVEIDIMTVELRATYVLNRTQLMYLKVTGDK